MNIKLVILVCLITCPKAYSQKGTEFGVKKQQLNVKNVNCQNFVGKHVYSFLLNDTVRNYNKLLFVDSKPFVLSKAIIVFNDRLYMSIYVSDFKFLKPFNPDEIWDKELFYQEAISKIEIVEDENIVLTTR